MNERTLFLTAAAITDPAARADYLQKECANDTSLRQRVEALLKAHDEAGSFLEKPAADAGATGAYTRPADDNVEGHKAIGQPSSQTLTTEGPGTRIGPYKLLQQIGEGGMGVVYMAEQEHPVRRRVTLKIIKAGMDSAQVVARFEAERQALAMMDHPNIAKVLDAGTTGSGRLYFVMELVKGIPVTKYCDQEHLSPKERLELFIPVCQAVQHAHQKGIIHRDLKPSNVLIALYDGRAVPKVIDFGVAKATSQKLTERTMFTEVGSIIGTLEYMAPEQAEFNNLDIDTRSDIYSLGVILYELLTGSPPFSSKQLRTAAFEDMLRIIREVEPIRPSTRLSSAEELASIAAKRKLEPKRLTRMIHGDLDWIVMKCLEKDRGRRYETASGLAADVERFLKSEPVVAGPPSTAYRLRKFVKRNRGAVAAASLVLMALIAGIVGTTLGLVHAREQQDAAEEARFQEADQRRFAVVSQEEAKAAWAEAVGTSNQLSKSQEELSHTLYSSQMNLIQNAWESDDIANVRELLERSKLNSGEKDLRGFEWHYWDRLAHAELRTVEFQSEMSQPIGFSADGARFATCLTNFDGNNQRSEIRVWDTASGAVIASLPSPSPRATVAFSPNGKRLAVFNKPTQGVNALTGKALKETGETELAVWNAETGKKLWSTTNTEGIAQLVFNESGEQLAGVIVTLKGPKKISQCAAKLWQAEDGHELNTWTLSQFDLQSEKYIPIPLAFSSVGKKLAAIIPATKSAKTAVLKIWDSTAGQEPVESPMPSEFGRISGFTGPLSGRGRIQFSPDGTRITAGVENKDGSPVLIAWDASNGKQLFSLKELESVVASVAFSPDSKSLMAIDPVTGTLTAWNSDNGEEQLHTATGTSAASTTAKGKGKGAGLLPTPSRVVFSPDGELITVTGLSGKLCVYDRNTGTLRLILKGHTGFVIDAAFDQDGNRLCTVGMDGTLRVWDCSSAGKASGDGHPQSDLTFELLTKMRLPQVRFNTALSPDGKRFAVALCESSQLREYKGVRVWDTSTLNEVFTLKPSKNVPGAYDSVSSGLSYGVDGKHLGVYVAKYLSFDEKGGDLFPERTTTVQFRATVCDPQTGQGMSELKITANSEFPNVALSPKGDRIASLYLASIDKKDSPKYKLGVWYANTGKQVVDASGPGLAGPVSHLFPGINGPSLVFSPDGNRLAALVASKGTLTNWEVKTWDAFTGSQIHSFEGSGMPIGKPAISPDGQLLAVAYMAGRLDVQVIEGTHVKVWDLATGKERYVLKAQVGLVGLVAFSRDGNRIATATAMNLFDRMLGTKVRIWDAKTGAPLLKLESHISFPTDMVFTTLSERLVLAGPSLTDSGDRPLVQVWDASPRSTPK